MRYVKSYEGFSRSHQTPIPSSLFQPNNYVQNPRYWNGNTIFLKYIPTVGKYQANALLYSYLSNLSVD